MFLADYHLHTTFSPDGSSSMESMALAADRLGVNEICFTDHVENCTDLSAISQPFPPFNRWEEYFSQYHRVQSIHEKTMAVRLGIELGSPHHNIGEAEKIYSMPHIDFVIGSVHSLRGHDDFYYMKYRDTNENNALVELYLKENIELSKTGCFDVLGHIGYMERYMAREGVFINFMDYEELLRQLFTFVIQSGKGIEVNTSSFSYLARSVPGLPVIKLYKSLGGEIITVGSDSHSDREACKYLKNGYEAIKEAGFEYVTVFRNHKPEFIKI